MKYIICTFFILKTSINLKINNFTNYPQTPKVRDLVKHMFKHDCLFI